MPIQTTDLKLRRSTVVNDTGANGGRMAATEIVDGVKNNIFPDAPLDEQAAGSLKYRKVFVHAANDDDITYADAAVFIETFTPGDDDVTLFAGTFENTQSGIATPRLYGGGKLNADVALGASSITVLVEDAADAIFQAGDRIRISDKATIGAGTGNEEYHSIAAGGVSWAGNVATITLDGTTLAAGYLASNTRVASLYEHGDVAATVGNWVETSASGTYDESGNPVEVDHIGGVSQEWTLTFTGATTFSVVGDVVGSVGSGSTGSDFSPNNPDHSKPYFTLRSAGWGGTWANGETITFRTDPAAIPIWLRRQIPPGSTGLTSNQFVVAATGQSA